MVDLPAAARPVGGHRLRAEGLIFLLEDKDGQTERGSGSIRVQVAMGLPKGSWLQGHLLVLRAQ